MTTEFAVRLTARRLVKLAALAVASSLVTLPSSARSAQGALGPCRSQVRLGVLPIWARTGFSDSKPRLPHIVGRSGRVAALVFGYPLLSPVSPDRANKVLWVSKAPLKPTSDLRISAQRMLGLRAIGRADSSRVAGGPGPSYLDLPTAGCWRLTLRWSGHMDTLDVEVAEP